MYFQAQLRYIIPGNFIGWRILPIPGFKAPKIPDNYTVEDVESVLARDGLPVQIQHPNPFSVPIVENGDCLTEAVFEFEKIGRKTFKVLRYVGELSVKYEVIERR